MFYDPLYDLDGDGKLDAAEEALMWEECMQDEQTQHCSEPCTAGGRGLSLWHILVLLWVILEVIAAFK